MWENAVDWLVYSAWNLPHDQWAGALNFFIYDTGKIFALLVTIIFAISLLRTFFPVATTKRLIAKLPPVVGNVLAALLGIVTPFCSCSAVPLFIGFVRGGIPLGVTFSFLIASPMINEVALVLLAGLFGWKVALIYIGTGLLIAIVAGVVIGLLKLEGSVEGFVFGKEGALFGGLGRHDRNSVQGLDLRHRGHRHRRVDPRLRSPRLLRRVPGQGPVVLGSPGDHPWRSPLLERRRHHPHHQRSV